MILPGKIKGSKVFKTFSVNFGLNLKITFMIKMEEKIFNKWNILHKVT